MIGENYYFDFNKNAYIKFHSRCKKCSKEYNKTNMQCDECLNNEKFFLTKEKNCLEITYRKHNFYYDYNFDLICINKTNTCPDFKPYELSSTKECIEKCNLNEMGIKCNPTNNIISINETYKILFNNIYNFNLEKKLFLDKQKFIINGNNVSFIFSTTEIEKKELYINFNSSSILINECENILKKNKPLVIFKIETTNNNSNYMNTYYELYNPFNFSEKIDLDLCQNYALEIRVPIEMKQYDLDLINNVKDLGYNIFNLSDPFYNDICSVFTYNNSDISLTERKNLLNLSNEIFCMINCNFTNIDINTMRSICICNSNSNYTEINNNKNKSITENILRQSIDFSKSSNIKVVKCFKIIFNTYNLKKNYGFYLILLTNAINILLLILYPFKKVDNQLHSFSDIILKQIKEVYENIKIGNNRNDTENTKEDDENKNKGKSVSIKQDNNKNELRGNNILKKNIKNIKIIQNISNQNNYLSNSKNNLVNISEDKTSRIDYIINNEDNKVKEEIFKKEFIEKIKKEKNSEYYNVMLIKNISFEKRKEYLSEIEINDLPYKYALLIDNRNNSSYYWSLLKQKNKIISIFLNREDYNIISMKISLFILTFNLSFTVNALFYTDEEIQKINQVQGSYNLGKQISSIIYSAIISTFISFLASYLSCTHDNFIKIRENKTYEEAEKFSLYLIKKLKIKYYIYFAISIIFNLLFFYYLWAFCAVYSITQTHMIRDSLISFLLSISYSILLTLIPPIFRKFSLSKNNKFRNFIYIISWLIALV